MENSIETMEQSIEPMETQLKLWNIVQASGKSMNTRGKPPKIMEILMSSANGKC